MGLAAGKLDRRLTIQRATVRDDGFQTAVGPDDWDDVATVWASRADISDSERGRAVGVQAQATTRFVIRYSSTVASLNPKDRVVCDGDTYAVTGVKMIGRRVGLEITAARRPDDG